MISTYSNRCLKNTESQNKTHFSEFFLAEISNDPQLQPILCGVFLSMYLIAVLGNLLIILAISSDSHLHTPMYFFLSNLALIDIGLISSTVPKMIVGIATQSTAISYGSCLAQMTFFSIFGCMDIMILAVMAYDRFVAICHPLHYAVIMNQRLCVFLVCLSFLSSFADSQVHNLFVLQFTNFKDVKISSFFCDPSILLNLVCTDTFSINIVKYCAGAIFGLSPASGIFYSYYKIVYNVMKISSKGARYKAFSTCGSHLSVVCLFYGTSFSVYFGSAVSQSPKKILIATIIYNMVTPMLNPFIYSLRNRDIQSALRRLHSRKLLFQILRQPF